MAAAEAKRAGLGRQVARGVGWMIASQVAIQGLAIATAVVMARFLSPRDVGLATEAIVFATLVLGVVDVGFAAVLVQRETLTELDLSTAFWAGMIFGCALTAAGIGLSYPLASLYGEPKVQSLFAVLSFTFLLSAPGMVHEALLSRELKFRSLGIRSIVATTTSAVVMIVLAVEGFGPWAIIAQYVAIVAVSTVLLWTSTGWRPRAAFSVASLKDMAGFTGHVFGSRALNWANMNLDNFLVGRFLGAAPLGAYSIAFSLAVTPVTRLALPLMRVFFPAFSRIRDPRQIAQVWLRADRMLALVVFPAMVGIVVVAPDFVSVVFGRKWLAAVPVLQLLALVGLTQAMTALNYGVLQSLDRTRLLFRCSVVISVGSICSFAAGLPWGISGVAAGYLIASLILQPMFVFLTSRAVGISFWDWLRSLRGVSEATIGMLVVVLAARELAVRTNLAVVDRLVLVVLVGAIEYAALVLWRVPELSTELRTLRARRQSASEATPVAGPEEEPTLVP